MALYSQRRKLSVQIAVVAAAVVLSPFGVGASEHDGVETVPPPAQVPGGLAYEVSISGDAPKALIELMREAALTVSLSDRPPASRTRLEARIADDLERFAKILRAEGYYQGTVSHTLQRAADGKRSVAFSVAAGPLYRIGAARIDYGSLDPAAEGLPRDLAPFGLESGAPARGALVIDAETRLVARLKELGFPFAAMGERQVTVDHRTTAMQVVFRPDPGRRMRFGEARFSGDSKVTERYLRRLVPWKPGDGFDQRKLDELGTRLRGTGLFASARITLGEPPAGSDRLPITVALTDRERRSIGLGASYSTSEDFGVELSWEHRNLFGRAERLRASVTAAQIRQVLGLDFELPNFRRLDQKFISETAFKRQDTEAFEELGMSETVRLERQLSPRWRAGAGASLDVTDIRDPIDGRTFALIGLPLFAARDNSNDLLNPTEGSRLRFGVTPFRTFIDESAAFLRSEMDAAAYLPLLDGDRVVLAGRARFGVIAGSETREIPATKRFYSGGGGSIRGFEFQKVGPLDSGNNPLGGRSVVELGLEARIRVHGPFGFVAFVEGGNVYDDLAPDLSDTPRVGAGVGFRYFTPIGPLRLDFGFPLNRRDGIDAPFQFYISLGQAF